MDYPVSALHIFNEIKFSGAEIMYAGAAEEFAHHGITIIAVSTGPDLGDYAPTFASKGIRLAHWPLPDRWDIIGRISYYIRLFKFLKAEKIGVTHIHRSDMYIAAMVSSMAGVRCIKTQHNTFRNRWFTKWFAITQRLVIRKCFGTIFHTIGESVYENELNYYRCPSTRINNWFDGDRFFPAKRDDEKAQVRLALGLPLDAYIIISSGSCSAIKNHGDIIRALALLNSDEEYFYLHLGNGLDEPAEVALAHELNVASRIRFAGNVFNVRDYLVAADLYVMSSLFEGLSIAAVESMASGLPVLLYDSPGLRELVVDNNNGFLVRKNPDALAEQITWLANNPDEGVKRGAAAARFAVTNYSMKSSVASISTLYRGARQ